MVLKIELLFKSHVPCPIFPMPKKQSAAQVVTGKILNGSTFDYYDPEAVRTGVTKEKTLLDTVSVCVSKIKKPKKGKKLYHSG